MFEIIINGINNALYSYVLIILLVLGGIYYIIASLVIFVGAGLSADLLRNIADVLMGGAVSS